MTLRGGGRGRMCTSCGVRWAQSSTGLCRRCEREGAAPTLDIERSPRRLPAGNLVVWTPPRPTRSVTVEHREYEIVWDGT